VLLNFQSAFTYKTNELLLLYTWMNLRFLKLNKPINLNFLKPVRNYKKKRVLFIVNPTSGEKLLRWINSQGLRILRSRYLKMDVIQTQYAGHAPIIVEENLNNYDIFVAVGGDGTANEVAGKLIGTDKIFSILPSGSGNGCARELKLPPIGTPLIRLLVKGVTKKIDVIYVNGRHSINVSGVGYDAIISKRFNGKESRGVFNYALIILKSLFFYKSKDYHFYVDGHEISTKAFLICFANTRQFGSNAFIAPDAKPDDGLIEVVVVKPFPGWYSFRFAFFIFTKRTNRSKYITTYRCKEILFDTTHVNWFHIDGDPVKLRGPVQITIQHQALKVYDTKKTNLKFKSDQ
jgi:diacylglycerol kinase (ATP)